MQRKVVADSSVSYGPLFEYSALRNLDEKYSNEKAELLSRTQWAGKYKSYNDGETSQSSLSRYEWLKTEIVRIHNLLFEEQLAVNFTAEEIRTILPKIKVRIDDILGITSFYENRDISGLSLDRRDLAELEEELDSLRGEIDKLELLLGKMCLRKIVIIYDSEEGLKRHIIANTSLTSNNSTQTDGHPHSTITLINADQEKRDKIAEVFFKIVHHHRKVILDINGRVLHDREDVSGILSKYSYYLVTADGLKPFTRLTDVADYFRTNKEEDWKRVVKFKIISDYARKHGADEQHVRESVSTYPVTHE